MPDELIEIPAFITTKTTPLAMRLYIRRARPGMKDSSVTVVNDGAIEAKELIVVEAKVNLFVVENTMAEQVIGARQDIRLSEKR